MNTLSLGPESLRGGLAHIWMDLPQPGPKGGGEQGAELPDGQPFLRMLRKTPVPAPPSEAPRVRLYSGISDTIMSWKQDSLLDSMHFQPSSSTNWQGASGPVTQQLETFHGCDLAGLQ